MISAAFSRGWEESVLLLLYALTESTLFSKQDDTTQDRDRESFICNESQALKIKMTKMI